MRKSKIMKLAVWSLVMSLVIAPTGSFAADIDESAQTQVNGDLDAGDLSHEDSAETDDESSGDNEDEAAVKTAGAVIPSSNNAIFTDLHIYQAGAWHSAGGSSGNGIDNNSYPVEAFKIVFGNNEYNAQIEYRVHISNVGWQEWKTGGIVAGTIGQNIEAIGIRFKAGSDLSNLYDIYYYVNTATFGQLGWASNGEMAGSIGMSEKLYGMYFRIEEKDSASAPQKTGRSYIQGYAQSALSYSGHVQNKGDVAAVTSGKTLGTVGQNLRVEGLKISLNSFGTDVPAGGVTYRTFVQNKAWMGWKINGAYAGTTGESLRIEGIQVKLTGEAADYYNIYYRVHVQNIGWMGWSANGATAGTSDMALRIEAVQIVLVAKSADQSAYNSSIKNYIAGYKLANLSYSGHVQSIGNTSAVIGGQTLGTVGKSLRMEGIKISLDTSGNNVVSGGITYRTHVQNIGWQGWQSNGEYAGTTGRSLRVEAIQIKLTGDAVKYFDVYYRTQVQGYGWLGWAKNGQSSGTSNCSYRMEAIQIKLVAKTQAAPGSTANYYREGKNGWHYEGSYKFYYSNNKKVEDVRSIIGKQSSYVIMVNKQQSCITVYAKDGSKGYIIPVVSFACSPGEATPLGTYYTPEKYRWKSLMGGVWGQYSTRITGGFLFHSVPYTSANIFSLKSAQYNKLGTRVSAGCVRLRVVDAKWIYDNCPLKTKVVIYNSSAAGPFTKPSYAKIPLSQTWDPTDPAVR